MPSNRVDVPVGSEFGRLVVISELSVRKHSSGGTQRWFRCRCGCGEERDVRLGHLRSGHTVSCGCHRVPPSPSNLEKMQLANLQRDDYHGMEGSPEWSVWRGIKRRCYQVNAKGYSNYGGRGIVMCYGWKSSFKAFFVDMGPRTSLDMSIDRKDNDGNYSCGHCEECVEKEWIANCRWATKAEQRRNARNVRMLTFRGETMCMADWANRKGMSKGALFARLEKMSVEEALQEPVRQCRGDQRFYQVPELDRDSEWRRDAARRASRSTGI